MTTTHLDKNVVLTNQKGVPSTPTVTPYLPGTNEDNGEGSNDEQMKDDIEVDETSDISCTGTGHTTSSPSSSNKRRKLYTRHHGRKDVDLSNLTSLVENGTIWDQKWMTKYKELQQYINNNTKDGKFPTTKNKEFGSWIKTQRTSYANKNQSLTKQKIELLEKLNAWSWGVGKQKPMNNNNNTGNTNTCGSSGNSSSSSSSSSNSVATKGSCKNTGMNLKPPTPPSPQLLTVEPTTTATTVVNDKTTAIRSTHTMTTEKKEQLGSLWDKKWMTKYKKLEQCIHENDGKHPTRKNKELGCWMKHQKEAYRNKNKSMTQYRIQLLEKIETWSWGKPTNQNKKGQNNSRNSGCNSINSSGSKKGSSNNEGTQSTPPPSPKSLTSAVDETTKVVQDIVATPTRGNSMNGNHKAILPSIRIFRHQQVFIDRSGTDDTDIDGNSTSSSTSNNFTPPTTRTYTHSVNLVPSELQDCHNGKDILTKAVQVANTYHSHLFTFEHELATKIQRNEKQIQYHFHNLDPTSLHFQAMTKTDILQGESFPLQSHGLIGGDGDGDGSGGSGGKRGRKTIQIEMKIMDVMTLKAATTNENEQQYIFMC